MQFPREVQANDWVRKGATTRTNAHQRLSFAQPASRPTTLQANESSTRYCGGRPRASPNPLPLDRQPTNTQRDHSFWHYGRHTACGTRRRLGPRANHTFPNHAFPRCAGRPVWRPATIAGTTARAPGSDPNFSTANSFRGRGSNSLATDGSFARPDRSARTGSRRRDGRDD